MKSAQENEMYMANANTLHLGPNTTCIPLAGIGSTRLGVGSSRLGVGSARLFGYQHVGIGNAKPSSWGSQATRDPNANGFALQWNEGLMFILVSKMVMTTSHVRCMGSEN